MKKVKTFLGYSFFLAFFPLNVLAQWVPAGLAPASGLPAQSIYLIIGNFMMWILGIFGFVGIIGFVISGIMYLTSAGNEDQINKAKLAMKWSIVGVIVGLGGFVIIWAVHNALWGNAYF